MTLPNFLVIGAAKAGTTSIYRHLNQHPKVYLPPMKETNFFALEGKDIQSFRYGWDRPDALLRSITEINAYESLFSQVAAEKAIGEVCPSYFYISDAPKNIAKHIPDAKIIVVLRNPIDRAYSHYLELVRQGRERLDFESAIRQENQRKQENWFWDYYYIDMGFYAQQLIRYFQLFPEDQVKVVFFEDFVRDTESFMRNLFEFLTIEPIMLDVARKFNSGWMPKQRWMYALYGGPHPLKVLLKRFLSPMRRRQIKDWYRNLVSVGVKPIDPVVRQKLVEIYASDINWLQELLQKDLNKWIS